jgi:hypothetical protein
MSSTHHTSLEAINWLNVVVKIPTSLKLSRPWLNNEIKMLENLSIAGSAINPVLREGNSDRTRL